MSSDAHAYDALGRILSSGGEQSYSLAIARGYSPSRIDSLMLNRFGDDYSAAGGLIAGFAAGMLSAGRRASELSETGGQLDPSEVPINGFLPDEEMAGQRYKWAFDVGFEGARYPVTTYVYTDSLDLENAIQEAIDSGSGTVDDYRKKFGLAEDAELIPVRVQPISIEGGF